MDSSEHGTCDGGRATGRGELSVDLQAAVIKNYVEPVLLQHGFRRRRNLFHAISERNFLLIEVQRSTRSRAGQLLITANLGIISRRVGEVMSPQVPLSPTFPTWHWRQRIGFLTPEKRDLWWSIECEDDLVVAGSEFASVIENFGVPALFDAATDEALRDLWLKGKAQGISELQRLLFLSAMLASLGQKRELDPVISRLYDLPPNDPSVPTVRAHLERIALVLSTKNSGAEPD